MPGRDALPAACSHFRTVSVAVFCTAASVAVSVTRVLRRTRLVVIVKVASVAPAGTVTLEGTTAAAALLLASVTATPPEGAAPVRVTFPVAFRRPRTAVGVTVSEASATAAGVETEGASE